MSRSRRVIAVAAAALVLLAGVAAGVLFTLRAPSSSGLDTELAGVSREPPRPTRSATVTTVAAPPPPPARPVAERPCWPQFGGDPHRSLARPSLRLGRPGKAVWARGLGGYIEYPATYCDGRLYVNTFSGTTYAIDSASGRVLWKRQGGEKPSSPAIAGPRLIVSSNDGTVTAYDRRSGARLWRLHVGSRVESSPLVVDGAVYVGAADGRLFRIAPATGGVVWAYQTGGEINSSPVAVANLVCITNYAGVIRCLRRVDGREVWSTALRRDVVRRESFYASASTDGARLYTIARSGKVVALTASSGRVVWTRTLRGLGYSTPAIAGGKVFVGGFDGALHAFDAATGRLVWRAQVGGRILGAPVVIGELVLFATLEQRAYAARVADGRVVWTVGMGKYSPAIATGDRYYMTLNGMLVAYRGSPG